MPVLAIGGEGKPGLAGTANDSGGFGRQGRGPAGTGHWVLEERPKETIEALMNFL